MIINGFMIDVILFYRTAAAVTILSDGRGECSQIFFSFLYENYEQCFRFKKKNSTWILIYLFF